MIKSNRYVERNVHFNLCFRSTRKVIKDSTRTVSIARDVMITDHYYISRGVMIADL